MTPNLGVTQIGGESESAGQRLVLADLPGLIEGAHQVCVSSVLTRVCSIVSTVVIVALSLNVIVISNKRKSQVLSQCNVRHQATTV